ncbi:LysR family transcriptional regulator [Streptomyces sp. NPDC085946]|uniref:LysR family transcriptional regulator n=1 Tax=Streptomyces sp. NPDC085946 TaxID=3365744 RepID=UPI0037D57334
MRVLVEVARAASVAEAARGLSPTPSALSPQISQPEAELGTRLPGRHSAGVTPTPVGAVLAEHAKRVIGELRQARAARSRPRWGHSRSASRRARSPPQRRPWGQRPWPRSDAVTRKPGCR